MFQIDDGFERTAMRDRRFVGGVRYCVLWRVEHCVRCLILLLPAYRHSYAHLFQDASLPRLRFDNHQPGAQCGSYGGYSRAAIATGLFRGRGSRDAVAYRYFAYCCLPATLVCGSRTVPGLRQKSPSPISAAKARRLRTSKLPMPWLLRARLTGCRFGGCR